MGLCSLGKVLEFSSTLIVHVVGSKANWFAQPDFGILFPCKAILHTVKGSS